MEIYRLLPRTNCGKCGTTCLGFAVKLLQGKARLEDCPLLSQPEYAANLEALRRILPKPSEHPVELVDPERCTGCGNCVVACPANVALEPETATGATPRSTEVIFRVRDGRVELLNPDKCRRNPPWNLQCRVCEDSCYAGVVRVR